MKNKKMTLAEARIRSMDLTPRVKADAKAKKAETPALPVVVDTCQKISVALYRSDLERTNEVMDYIYKKRGLRVSRSEAVKIALRLVPISDALITALESIRLEDKRGRR